MLTGVLVSVTQAIAKNSQPYCTLQLRTIDDTRLSINVWQSNASDFSLFKLTTITGEVVNAQGISCKKSQVEQCEITDEYRHLIPVIPTFDDWMSVNTALSGVGRIGKMVKRRIRYDARSNCWRAQKSLEI